MNLLDRIEGQQAQIWLGYLEETLTQTLDHTSVEGTDELYRYRYEPHSVELVELEEIDEPSCAFGAWLVVAYRVQYTSVEGLQFAQAWIPGSVRIPVYRDGEPELHGIDFLQGLETVTTEEVAHE